MYEVRCTTAKLASVARKKVVCLASHTRRNGLNEPREDFIGTGVQGNTFKKSQPTEKMLLLNGITTYTHQKS